MPDISTYYLGLKLTNPLIAASCGITNSLENIKELEKQGIGAVVLKSLFEEEIITEMEHQRHRMYSENYLYPETLEYYENFNTEDILISYLKLINQCKRKTKLPIIASINCITPYNWPYFAQSLQEAGADALELNIFVIPADFKKSALENEEIYLSIIKEVKDQVSIPISVKLSPYFSNLGGMIKKISEMGIGGITLFNKLFSPDIDINNLEITTSHVFSSPTDYILPLRWTAIMAEQIECDISATTGIHDGKTLVKMLLAGATTVQVASCLYSKGIKHVSTILSDLRNWMELKQYQSITDFSGKLSQSKAGDSAGFWRVQFMKHFSETKY